MERRANLSSYFELLSEANQRCSCEFTEVFKTEVCSHHEIVAGDPVILDNLLFMRWMKPRLIAEEFMIEESPQEVRQEDDNSDN